MQQTDVPAADVSSGQDETARGRLRRVGRWCRRPDVLVPAGLALVLFVIYARVSLLRIARGEAAAYDLGIFDEAIRSYAHFHAPMVPIKAPGFNLLGDHFHPIIALVAPFYWIWPSVKVLVVVQAGIIAASVIPVTRFAMRRLGALGGVAVGISYGLSFGVQGAVTFDFHEVAFAAPLLAFAVIALAEERWRAAILWTLPLLLVKEDQGLTVAAIGVYLFAHRRRRAGAALVVTGLGTLLLLVLVVIPALNHVTHAYRYWGYVGNGTPNQVPGVGQIWHTIISVPHEVVTPIAKLWLVFLVIAVTGFGALLSPITLLVVPTLLWRLISPNSEYWNTGEVHYNLVLMPVMFVALVDGIGRARRHRWFAGEERWRRGVRVLTRLVPAGTLAISLLSASHFPLWLEWKAPHKPSAHVEAMKRLAKLIPDNATVAASNYLVPLIVDRTHTVLFPNTWNQPAQYAIVDSTNLYGVPLPHDQQEAYYQKLPSQGYHEIASDDGVTLWEK